MGFVSVCCLSLVLLLIHYERVCFLKTYNIVLSLFVLKVERLERLQYEYRSIALSFICRVTRVVLTKNELYNTSFHLLSLASMLVRLFIKYSGDLSIKLACMFLLLLVLRLINKGTCVTVCSGTLLGMGGGG